VGAALRALTRLAAYAALGPITGPLAAGLVRSLGRGEHLLTGLYLAAIPAAWSLLAAAGGSAAHHLILRVVRLGV
jgi:hypothetical protein